MDSRRAFSIIEVIVVLAIIGIVTALLVPAVQRVREAANRTVCQTNLHQLCVAAHSFNDARKHLPPGLLGPPNGTLFDPDTFLNWSHVGVLPWLLPYLEQAPLHKRFVLGGAPKPGTWQWDPDFKYAPGPNGSPNAPWWKNATNEEIARTRIATFICPSDTPYANQLGTFTTLYAGGLTFTVGLMSLPRGDYGRTNYLPSAGGFGDSVDKFWGFYKGPFFNHSRVALHKISDGTSNTLLFGEALGGPRNKVRPYSFTWMGSGPMVLGWGLIDPGDYYTFNSNHTGGIVQFGFGDGSVRAFRTQATDNLTNFYEDNWYALMRAGGYADGEGVDFSQLE